MLLFLENASQVIEGEYLKFAEGVGVSDILGYFGQHDHIHSLGYKLRIGPGTVLLDVLHGELVDLLDEVDDLILDAEGGGLLGLHDHGEVDQFLFAEDALNGILLLPLAETLDDGPDVEQDLLIGYARLALSRPQFFLFYRKHNTIYPSICRLSSFIVIEQHPSSSYSTPDRKRPAIKSTALAGNR